MTALDGVYLEPFRFKLHILFILLMKCHKWSASSFYLMRCSNSSFRIHTSQFLSFEQYGLLLTMKGSSCHLLCKYKCFCVVTDKIWPRFQSQGDSPLYALPLACNAFLRFTSGATPADLLTSSRLSSASLFHTLA